MHFSCSSLVLFSMFHCHHIMHGYLIKYDDNNRRSNYWSTEFRVLIDKITDRRT
jgi:hypothetical protein